MSFVLALGGLVLLLAGGDLLVRGAVGFAANLGASPMLIGLTIVAFGTSAPELMIGADAALTGFPGMALGNVIGSNIANVLLVLGAPALLAPIACGRTGVVWHVLIMLGASLIFSVMAYGGVISLVQGLLLLAMLGIFVWHTIHYHRAAMPPVLDMLETDVALGGVAGRARSKVYSAAMFLGGLAGLILGADLLTGNAVNIARQWNVGEDVIGISLIAIGTSLPELATTLAAAYRRHTDMALGNVIGSNIFNILAVMGITATLAPVPVPQRILVLDLPVMLVSGVILLCFTATGRPIGRGVGSVFLLGYAIYIIALYRHGQSG